MTAASCSQPGPVRISYSLKHRDSPADPELALRPTGLISLLTLRPLASVSVETLGLPYFISCTFYIVGGRAPKQLSSFSQGDLIFSSCVTYLQVNKLFFKEI